MARAATRRTSTDRVTPDVALAVLARDGGCMAPRLGGSFMDCWGRNTLAHVKSEPRMGRRAKSTDAHLVTICEGHAEAGMRAGYVWVTDRHNIEKMREYLLSFEENQ
jgi:hypothetical protein